MAGGLEPTIQHGTAIYNLSIPVRAERLLARVKEYIADDVDPVTQEFFELGRGRADPWSFAPGQLELLSTLKQRAKELGLWNLFLPEVAGSNALSNLEYAYLAFELGKNPLASECVNCSAPDTGNMEVLLRVGTPTQRQRWLDPLLSGETRSAFAMTEPDVASSDAKNISCRAELDGDEWVINGEKYFVTGAGDPRCEFLIVMVRTNPSAARHLQHTQLIVPMNQAGLEKVGPMLIFGHDDAPHGHFHLRFNDVRVPRDHTLLGEGRGFEVSQLRLGPGRIHHCMRSIGAAEVALQLMVARGLQREAFGRPLIELGKNMELISRARIDIEAMRLVVLRAARAMDLLGTREASVWVSAAKALVPETACRIIDEAMQLHGATGISQWTPLADMFMWQRALRFADGPDEVHHMVVARAEVAQFKTASGAEPA